MGSITETRTKLMDIPEVIADVYFALENEDFEDLSVMRDLVQKVWNDGNPRFRNSLMRILVKNLNKMDLHERRDLNGFFSDIVGEQISQYQTVKTK